MPKFDLAALFPVGSDSGGSNGESSGDDAEIARAYTAQRLLDASPVHTVETLGPHCSNDVVCHFYIREFCAASYMTK